MLRGLAAASAVIVGLALAPAASALTYKVTTRSDHAPGACTSGDCTLREAVRAANATLTVADTIVLPSTKLYRLTIAGTDEDGAMTGDLDIANFGLRIVHPGPGKATIGGNGLDRVFDVFLGAPATFEKLILQGGHAVGLTGHGGGIRSGEKITLRATIIRENRADICGGGVHMQNGGRLVMRNSKVTGNKANFDGGGISASCQGGAGAASIVNSTVSLNRADADGNGNGRGGGIYLQTTNGVQSTILRSTWSGNRSGSEGGGIYTDLGKLRLEASTVNGNTARLGGGGVSVDGTEPLLVVNSTVAGNRSASSGGGIYADGGSVVRLNAVSVVRNRANTDGVLSEAGGGLFADLPAGDFVVLNSLIALNTIMDIVPGSAPIKNDCASDSPFTSQGHNLLSTRFFCDGFSQPSDRARTNPRLGNLGLHGGPTKTVPLLANSPALNRAGASAPSRDQRGVKRRDPDIGAYERRVG